MLLREGMLQVGKLQVDKLQVDKLQAGRLLGRLQAWQGPHRLGVARTPACTMPQQSSRLVSFFLNLSEAV